jgi:hypothetical protein
MASSVSLARGQAWRIEGRENNKAFSPLGNFEASFVMSRQYFINPEEYEITSMAFKTEDWSTNEHN